MAAKTTKKKSPSKTPSRSGGKKASANAPVKKDAPEKRVLSEGQKQVITIFMGAISILLFFIVILPAGGAWNAMRIVLFGLFGFAAYILPVILIVLDAMILMGRMNSRLAYKIAEALILMTLLVSLVHIIKYDPKTAEGFGERFIGAFNEYHDGGSTVGAGCLGALIGGGILALTGGVKYAAIILASLMLAVFLMLFTGTTIINLYHSLKKPVKKVGEYTEDKIEQFKEASASRNVPPADEFEALALEADKHMQKKKNKAESKKTAGSDIDIPIDDEPSKDLGIDEFFTEIEKNKAASRSQQSEPEFLRLINGGAAQSKKPVRVNDLLGQNEAAKTEKAKTAEQERESAPEKELKKEYVLPPIECLREPTVKSSADYSVELQNNAKKIVQTLSSFGVSTRIVDICRSPSVTRYELQPDPGVKISRITSLADDLALNLAAAGVRIEAPIPNKSAVGIEVPNKDRNTVLLRELIDTAQFRSAKSMLNVALGSDIQGTPTFTDLAKMPHLLIAGTTGSGKSVCLNTMIISLLYNAKPQDVKIIMIDPKMVEFTVYSGIPHLLVPVVSDPRKASGALSWAVSEMEKRYKLFSEIGARNLQGYNDELTAKGGQPLPQIVIFIDELSDLMMVASNEVETSICRLAQKARAAGMHLVVATQRPSVDVITGLIKANIPSRLALAVSSRVDSNTILDAVGAEKLLGNGDMLFCPVGMSKAVRLQGAYISDDEIEAVVDHIKAQEQTNYDDEVMEEIERQAAIEGRGKRKSDAAELMENEDDSDEMLPKAIEVVVEAGMASTTLLQRKLKLGYARAARIVDELSERGIIGPFEGSKPRKVLITKQQWYEMKALSPAASQVTYEDVLSESRAPGRTEESEDEELSSGEHNYFGGYTRNNYEDVFSSSYSDEKKEDE